MVAFPEDFDHGGNSGESVPRLHAVASAVPLSQVPLVIDITIERRGEEEQMFDAIQNKFGFWVGRFRRKDGVMVECTNAFHDEYRARNVAERMAESYERNRRAGNC